MYLITYSIVSFCLATTIHTAAIAKLITSITALTQQTITIDVNVVALSAQSPPATAKQIPPSLQDLTTAITTTLKTSTPTPPSSDPAVQSSVLSTYGLFANEIWELMDDCAYQNATMILTFGLKTDMYAQLREFDTAFQDLSTFTTMVLVAEGEKVQMGYYVGNTTRTIDLAIAAFGS